LAETFVELGELGGIGPPGIVGGVEARLDRGREQPEHDRGEGDQQADGQLHQFDRVACAVPFGQAGSDEISDGRGREQQDQEQGGGPEFGHVDER